MPFSSAFLQGGLFAEGGELDRDGGLAPWREARLMLVEHGWEVCTIDQVDSGSPSIWLHLDSFNPPPEQVDTRRSILIMWEPEVVAPYWYRRARLEALPFRIVFTHSKALVQQGNPYRYLYWPQPLMPAAPALPRAKRLVMINGRKYPAVRRGELYSAREEVAAWFARRRKIEIYGTGWTRSSPRHPIAALRTRALSRAYCGRLQSKFEILRASDFVLCFENMRERGYRTEKLFDVLAAGAIPIYLGDPDISEVVDPQAFVDYSAMAGPSHLNAYLDDLSEVDKRAIRDAGRQTLSSTRFDPYTLPAFGRRLAEAVQEASTGA